MSGVYHGLDSSGHAGLQHDLRNGLVRGISCSAGLLREVFRIPGQPEFQFFGEQATSGVLFAVQGDEPKEVRLEEILVVQDFLEVFLEDLPELPPEREIKFFIKLVPGCAPISQALYQMAPAEFQELMVQLQELLDKNFVWLSVSP